MASIKASSANKDGSIASIEPKLREKKPMPGVKYLLEHGDPDSPPSTFKETAMFIAALFVTFVVSFIVCHHLVLKDTGPGQEL